MKLLTFEEQGLQKLGIQTDKGIIDVEKTAENLGNTNVKTDIMEVIAGGKEA